MKPLCPGDFVEWRINSRFVKSSQALNQFSSYAFESFWSSLTEIYIPVDHKSLLFIVTVQSRIDPVKRLKHLTENRRLFECSDSLTFLTNGELFHASGYDFEDFYNASKIYLTHATKRKKHEF